MNSKQIVSILVVVDLGFKPHLVVNRFKINQIRIYSRSFFGLFFHKKTGITRLFNMVFTSKKANYLLFLQSVKACHLQQLNIFVSAVAPW